MGKCRPGPRRETPGRERQVRNMLREGLDGARIPAGCAVSSIFSKSGQRRSGEDIIRSIALMHDRSNGLGGGFAAYGIYPEYKNLYALHVFYQGKQAKDVCEAFINEHFDVVNLSKIPTRKTPKIKDEPLIWRYFVEPLHTKLAESQLDEDTFVSRCVIRVNSQIDGAYIFSSGKDMGVFKAVGYPEDVGDFYRLEDYKGYCWTAHGRYPTNTPGWWGGAHPFALLDRSVVHNGEISSYDANRRAIEMYGYQCNLLTDTEVITYIIDFLVRRRGLSYEEAASVIAAPFWSTIGRMEEKEKARMTYLRAAFGGDAYHRALLHFGGLYRRHTGFKRQIEAAQHGGGRAGRHRVHRQRGERHPGHRAGAGHPVLPPGRGAGGLPCQPGRAARGKEVRAWR